jgi:hypothetical protein
MVFERKVSRKLFGPTNENGIWRTKTNQELDKIIKHNNIINFIRAQNWDGFVTSKGCKKKEWSRQYTPGNPFLRKPIGRPKIRWENDVRKDVQKLKVPNWKTLSRIEEDGRNWLTRPKLCI